MHQKYYRASSL